MLLHTAHTHTHVGSWGNQGGSEMHKPRLDVYHLKASLRWVRTGSSWQQQQQAQKQQSHHLQMLQGTETELKISVINIPSLMCFGMRDRKQKRCLLLGLVWHFLDVQDHKVLVSGKLQFPRRTSPRCVLTSLKARRWIVIVIWDGWQPQERQLYFP